MSNQRPGKLQSRPEMGMTQEMGTLKFFKLAQKVLEKEGKMDEAFNLNNGDWVNLEKGCHYRGRCYKGVRYIGKNERKEIVREK